MKVASCQSQYAMEDSYYGKSFEQICVYCEVTKTPPHNITIAI